MAQQERTLPRLRAELERAPAADIERFSDAVRPLLDPLARHVRREMAFLRARGELDGDFPAADDVVDETLVRAWHELRRHPQAAPDKGMLYRIAGRVLADAVRQRRRERGRFISLERRLPERQALDEDIDQAVYDYWQPEQVLKLEDAVPIDAPTPEEAVERDELRRVLRQVLAELPDDWRQAVLLTQAEDLPHAEVARQLGISEEELQRRIDHADAYLRARLSELGVGPGEARDAARRNAPPGPHAPADDSLGQAFERIGREAIQRPAAGRPS
ncbi:RNA polymerase sigma factor [Ramlibacter ginsenosidimutans]|uniref:RNA polymerase sigma factor n=1 Tax=Ramlibacter ginsenosidimutans TaxID=502333 RepID=A0A934TV52_9BURK|nr:RNA polymerase sigma factor [Ramlibacter ginsenosidimutans]MBK6007928.1 RNA polymerase sigma factor [Ramlibacter ginsenosidimutans]